MIDAKLKGVAEASDELEDEPQSNVIDLMAALKKSLGDTVSSVPVGKAAQADTPAKKRKAAAADDARRQPALKLPIEGGRKPAKKADETEPLPAVRASRSSRKAS